MEEGIGGDDIMSQNRKRMKEGGNGGPYQINEYNYLEFQNIKFYS